MAKVNSPAGGEVRQRRQKLKVNLGFTLIELIVATAMMALLAGVTIAGFRETEKTKSLIIASDVITNAVRTAQNRSLTSEQIANSTCVIGSVPDRSAVSFIVLFNSQTVFNLYAVDKCGNSNLVESYQVPSKVTINTYAIDSATVNSLQVKFTTPFGQVSVSSSPTVNQGPFANFTTARTTAGIESKTKTVTIDGISGRISE